MLDFNKIGFDDKLFKDHFKAFLFYAKLNLEQMIFGEKIILSHQQLSIMKSKSSGKVIIKNTENCKIGSMKSEDDFKRALLLCNLEYSTSWIKIAEHLTIDGEVKELNQFVTGMAYLLKNKWKDKIIKTQIPETNILIELTKTEISISYAFDNRYKYTRKLPDSVEEDPVEFALWAIDSDAYEKTFLYNLELPPDTLETFVLLMKQSGKSSKEIAKELATTVQTLSKIINRKMVPKSEKLRNAITKYTKGIIPENARW
jgi:antitoxin component HigA of HigAB toxin-antitoxin module